MTFTIESDTESVALRGERWGLAIAGWIYLEAPSDRLPSWVQPGVKVAASGYRFTVGQVQPYTNGITRLECWTEGDDPEPRRVSR